MEQIVIIQEKNDEWESLVSKGLEIRENQDNNQWALGELASSVESRYGEDSIGKFSVDIGVVKKTLMNYRTVWNKFENSGLREKYLKLSFSHFKAASKSEEPEYWLNLADTNDWGVEMLSHSMSENNPDPKIEDIKPEVYKCKDCGLWRIRDVPNSSQCRGHYVYKDGKIRYS